MKSASAKLLSGTLWTSGAFGLSQILRIASSMIMTRLLSPELFGIMVIVYSIRTGIDLLTDVGLGHSVVTNKDADKPEFYDTAWSLRLARGLILWLGLSACAIPIAQFYETPILAWIIPVAALYFLFAALANISPTFLQRRMQTRKLSIFELAVEVIAIASQIVFALISPTVWALVFGMLMGSLTRSAGTYVLMPTLRHRFRISREYASQILSFGKWIFLSSTVFFLAQSFDRLYLGTVISLEVLGIYGIARTLSETLNTLSSRLNFIVIFPLIASHADGPRSELRAQLRWTRARFMLAAAAGFALFAGFADIVVRILYDSRYQDAGWMLPLLVVGIWFAVMCAVNESTLLGFRKPVYGALANTLKLAWLVVGLPLGVAGYGIAGVVIVVALSDLVRYVPILVGQFRERFSFALQDAALTLAMFAMLALVEWARWTAGLGTSFDRLPGLW